MSLDENPLNAFVSPNITASLCCFHGCTRLIAHLDELHLVAVRIHRGRVQTWSLHCLHLRRNKDLDYRHLYRPDGAGKLIGEKARIEIRWSTAIEDGY